MADLATTIQAISSQAGLSPSDLDLSDVPVETVSMTISNIAPAQSTLDVLRRRHFIDPVEDGYQIVWRQRDQSGFTAIPYEDLIPLPGSEEPVEIVVREQPEIPRELVVRFIHEGRNYQVSAQPARRQIYSGGEPVTIDIPLVMGATKARQVADRTLMAMWGERIACRFATSMRWAHIIPGTPVRLTLDDGNLVIRIRPYAVDIGEGRVMFEGFIYDRRNYDIDFVPEDDSIPDAVVSIPDEATLLFLDIPALRLEDANDFGWYSGAAPAGVNTFEGATLFRSADDSNYTALETYTAGAIYGFAETELPEGLPYIFDEASTVDVVMTSGSLVSVTDVDLSNGSNLFLLGEEIFQAGICTLTAPDSYTLSHLVRGLFGTEQHMGTHTDSDLFVKLNLNRLKRINDPQALAGMSRFYKMVRVGLGLASVTADELTNTAIGRKPLSPAHVRGWRQGTGSDWRITWSRRVRGHVSGLTTGPLQESSETYEIDFIDAGDVVATRSVGAPPFTYTVAMQNADFGTTKGTLKVEIFQISSIYGRGFGTGEIDLPNT